MTLTVTRAHRQTRSGRRDRRRRRVRKKIVGTAARPRLSVFRSNRHIVAQLIDDTNGTTLAAASSHEADLRADATGNVASASAVGGALAERAKQAGITSVVFDRGGNKYHGRVAALADAARAGGLQF